MSKYSSACVWLASASLLLFCAGGCDGGALKAQSPQEQKIHKFFELTGKGQTAEMAKAAALDQIRQVPDVKPELIELFETLADVDELTNKIVSIYTKHLDDATLDALLAFAATPGGKKFFQAQPLIQQEAASASMQWGQQLFEKINAKLEGK